MKTRARDTLFDNDRILFLKKTLLAPNLYSCFICMRDVSDLDTRAKRKEYQC